MRAALTLTIATLTLLAGFAHAQPTPDAHTLELYADWPDTIDEAMNQPIPITPLFPYGEDALHDGPLTPGSETLDTLPTFTYKLINPDHSPGPAGDLPLDPTQPVTLTLYLSADKTNPPTDTPHETPIDPRAGIAPPVTVEATLTIGQDTITTHTQTQTLLTTNHAPGEPVTPYTLTLPHDRDTLHKGEGLNVTFTIHQTTTPETTTQPKINIHTGQDHPTHITLPTQPNPTHNEPLQHTAPLNLDQLNDDPETTLTAAVILLTGSTATAALAGTRLIKQTRF